MTPLINIKIRHLVLKLFDLDLISDHFIDFGSLDSLHKPRAQCFTHLKSLWPRLSELLMKTRRGGKTPTSVSDPTLQRLKE